MTGEKITLSKEERAEIAIRVMKSMTQKEKSFTCYLHDHCEFLEQLKFPDKSSFTELDYRLKICNSSPSACPVNEFNKTAEGTNNLARILYEMNGGSD